MLPLVCEEGKADGEVDLEDLELRAQGQALPLDELRWRFFEKEELLTTFGTFTAPWLDPDDRAPLAVLVGREAAVHRIPFDWSAKIEVDGG